MKRATLAVTGGRLICPGGGLRDSTVFISGRVISGVADAPPGGAAAGRLIDARGCYVCPGFIDPHVHGAAGADFLTADEAAARRIARAHARYGTTALFATVRSAPLGMMERAAERLAGVIADGGSGIAGIHLEGPFLNPSRAGIHPPEHLRPPSAADLERLLDAAAGAAVIVTLAPELPGAPGLIGTVRARGGVPALGHSDADYAAARAAFDAGARYVTHLFNAMSGTHHRAPGLAAAALSDDRVSAELIADGVHVHPEIAKIALKLKGGAGIVLVTDCMQALDSAAAEFTVGGRRVSVRNGAPAADDGTLCGSVLTMSGALRNVGRWTGGAPERVAALAAEGAARALGLGGRKGALAPGMDADIVIFDEGYDVKATVIGGEVAWAAPGFGRG
jgi:N-acetylglucosamine-6-phosphate deacetylase